MDKKFEEKKTFNLYKKIMFNLLYNLKKFNKIKSRSKKPSLETIPENKVLYTRNDVNKNEIINTVFMNDHWSLPNKKT
jgi:hypothetical protein